MRCWTHACVMTDMLPDRSLSPPRPPTTTSAEPATADPEGRPRGSFLRAFATHRLGVAGLVLVVLLLAFCFLGPLVYHTDQVHTNLEATNLAPGHGHLLGTDGSGYDILGRLMVGGRYSLEIGLAVAALATLLGGLGGAIAGFTGGALDAIMMRIVDVMLAVPAIFILIYLATVLRPTVVLLIIVFTLLSWLGPARRIRGETLSLRTREFRTPARA